MKQLSLFPDLEITKPDTYVASINSECKRALKIMAENGIKVDSIVTDPPYELGFMGKSWDSTGIAYDKELWELCLSVLKPGGHLLAFGGSRTYHRMTCAIEDAGFEIRDQIMWVYGQGFPKSLNIGKAIDKMAGAERTKLKIFDKNITNFVHPDVTRPWMDKAKEQGYHEIDDNNPISDAAKQWDGFGTQLKPAHEPCVLARKPLDKGCNIAQNVLKHGTGGINVDGCRIEHNGQNIASSKIDRSPKNFGGLDVKIGEPSWTPSRGRFPSNLIHDGSEEVLDEFAKYGERFSGGGDKRGKEPSWGGRLGNGRDNIPQKIFEPTIGTAARFFKEAPYTEAEHKGRWPSNLIHDGSEEVEAEFAKYGERQAGAFPKGEVKRGCSTVPFGTDSFNEKRIDLDKGSASRFFYSAKASKRDRCGSKHPTVKPIALMRYLCRLITPPNGIILDPFAGTGTTGQAAQEEGFHAILIEKDETYFQDIVRRIYGDQNQA